MKKTKIIALILCAIMLVTSLPFAIVARDDATYTITEYKFDRAPKSLIISFYDGILSRGFAWYTDNKTDETKLYIAEGVHGESYDFEALAKDCSDTAWSSLVWDDVLPDETVLSHHAHVEGLDAGKYYSYKLGGNGNYVYGVFKTADKTSFTMLNFNDPQTKNADMLNYWENTVKTATSAFDYDFVLNGGDLYDSNMEPAEINRFIRWGAGVDTETKYTGSIPTMFASGNHEPHTPMLYPFSNEIKYGGMTEEKTTAYYSFTYGNVHFAVLAYISKTGDDEFKAEMNWLKDDLAKANADENIKWTVVCTHYGPYTTGDHTYSDSVIQLASKLTPILSEYHVDLVLQAHDHTYSKTLPYLWDGKGVATSKKVLAKAVNLEPATVEIAGVAYEDATKNGTYYVSAGAAGHRIGENTEYAEPTTGKYLEAPVQIAVGKVTVDSAYAKIGDPASADFNETMFGTLTVAGDTLVYDFYIATENGEAVLIDSLKLYKGNDETKSAAEALNAKLVADKGTDAFAADYAEYLTADDEVKLLLTDEAKAAVAEYAKTAGTSEAVAEAKNAVDVIAVDKSEVKDGKQNIRFVVEADKSAKSCEFEITYYLNGKEQTATVKATEGYTKSVSASADNGILTAHEVDANKIAFAVTVKDVPADAIVTVTPKVNSGSELAATGNAVSEMAK